MRYGSTDWRDGMVTLNDLHAVLRAALDSGEWTADELHAEVDSVAAMYDEDEAAERDDG